MRRITALKVLPDYRLEIAFDDGRRGVVDLSPLAGKGVFAAWRDYSFFEKVRIGETGELAWGDKIDLCPDALYLKVTGQTPEDVFPALKRAPAHA